MINRTLLVHYFNNSKDAVIKIVRIEYIVFFLLFMSSLFFLENKLQNSISSPHPDEVHTVRFAFNSLYSGEVTTLRVGESTRWMARIAHPVALYYMNSRMGGEHNLTGWGYPSGNYLKKHYTKDTAIKSDANIQDYMFAMRFILGFFVMLSFLIASFLMTQYYGVLSGVLYYSLALSMPLVNGMLKIFYTESTLIILFNCILILAFCKKINILRLYFWSAFTIAFAVSTKLTGVLFSLPIVVLLFSKNRNVFKGMYVELFFVLVLILFLLTNIFASSYTALLDQTLANVYHLKTGHLHTQPSGMYQLERIFKTLSPWLIVFLLSVLYLFSANISNKKFVIAVSLSALMMMVSLVDVSYFMSRLLTTPLVMMVFIISISITTLMYRFKGRKYYKLFVKSLSVICLFLFIGYNVDKYYVPINLSSVITSMRDCENVALIDIEDNVLKNTTILESMPDAFTLRDQEQSFRDQFNGYDCVAIKRIKNNKHYTNYLLSKDFFLRARIGNYFVYKKD